MTKLLLLFSAFLFHVALGTIVVSSKSHPKADFSTVQGAIDSLPNDNSSQVILILTGDYTEQVNITRPGPVTLLGQTDDLTDASKNTVNLIWAAADGDDNYPDDEYTSTLTVSPTLDASLTGSGVTGFDVPDDTPFGNKDFRMYNINLQNIYANYSAGPALAISFSRSNGGFYYCGFYSYQDTVYIGKLGNAYFYESIIAGQTDFFYGFGTAWVQSSQILLRGCGGGITAWKGYNTTFENKYGIYIVDSRVTAANASVATEIVGQCALGRPWNSLDRTIFARTYEDASIISTGYINWLDDGVYRYNNHTLFAEYKAYGPGFNLTGRIEGGLDEIMTDEEYEPYSTPAKVFQTPEGEFGNTAWIDTSPWN
ncbi:hypothetical protein ASPZODRAFT_150448 [Penicilliopsis zonata CBS 506.65]|uniref:pectinesterase n=1 Tax=Penicilliopsis zonata CBS 506.65 TaxID=1073090 RepID=A0A1L9SM37_9EURO|nr:hypothetical protein ASPZODRAFT_150448 [Penicilliopsis zonata CBS 506.65]OJJ48161.1 hypothetical protein ASPZODRAFT_150448 [Penicilliopsis zonata CBS 506.65]